MKSTGGTFLVLVGPNTFFPLTGSSKQHGSTSNSSTEAEIVTLAIAVRTVGIPALDLFEELLGRKVLLVVFEDNQATATIVRTGKFEQSMGHVKRCHGVQLGTLTERLADGTFIIEDCHTEGITKHFITPHKWVPAKQLIGILSPEQRKQLIEISPAPMCEIPMKAKALAMIKSRERPSLAISEIPCVPTSRERPSGLLEISENRFVCSLVSQFGPFRLIKG